MFIQSGSTRSRMIPGPLLFMKEERKPTGPSNAWSQTGYRQVRLDGIQITESDGNRWPPPKGDLQDYGSEFFSQRKECVTKHLPITILNLDPTKRPGTPAGTDWRLTGTWIASPLDSFSQSGVSLGQPYSPWRVSFPPDLSSSRASLVTKGATAVAMTAPTNRVAEVASFVGELLQDVPAIPGLKLWESRLRALGALSAAGSEFLNYQFGISPTIGDMLDFTKAVHKLDKAVDQVIRDSGRVVRRRYYFPKERTVTEDWFGADGQGQAPPGQYYIVPNGTYGNDAAPNFGAGIPTTPVRRTRVTEREIWFSGAFTYHLPSWFDSHDRKSRMALTAKLLGAQPDLNTLWQLAPWSWAIDWFSNAGSFIKNLQALISYGQVLKYGYVMETTTTTDTYTPFGPYQPIGWPGAVKRPFPSFTPITLRTTTKKRIKANPFGFGVSWEGLSPTQLAISAALGITRVVK